MKEIYKNLYIGNDTDCSICINRSDFVIVHACKTCHQRALGYMKSLPDIHPNYLIYENKNHIFLNMVDMAQELDPKFTHPMFKAAMDFISSNITNKKVLVHCNQGQSRSPSVGLVYLAKHRIISNTSCIDAVHEFIQIYPDYRPGHGIMQYIKNNWNYLIN